LLTSLKSISDNTQSTQRLSPYVFLKSDAIRGPVIFTIIILLISGSYINFNIYHSLPVKLHKDFGFFPYQIEEWKGMESEPDYKVFRTLGVDHDLSRTYRTSAGQEVKLYVGYYESQNQGKELINYQSERLHINAQKMRIALSPGKVFEVNKEIKREGQLNRLVLFWYNINGRTVTDKYKAKAYTTWDALRSRRSNGAIIMVYGDSGKTGEDPAMLASEEDFVRKLMPVLHNYVP